MYIVFKNKHMLVYKLKLAAGVGHRASLSFCEVLQPFKLRNYLKTNKIKFFPIYNNITKD